MLDRFLVLCLVAALAVAGCKQLGLADTSDNYSRTMLGDGTAIVTGADLRLVTSRPVSPSDTSGRVKLERVTCAEPSPDVATALSTSLSGAFQGSGQGQGVQANVNAALGLAAADSIAELGERLATIQLLRDEFADLCRSFSNGAVSATTYSLRLAKLDRKMVTLLLGEMTAGAFGRNLATIAGNATSSVTTVGSAADIKAAEDELSQDQAKVKSATDAQASAQKTYDADQKSGSSSVASDKSALDKANQDLNDALTNQAQAASKLAALRQLTPSAAAGASVMQPGGIVGRPSDVNGAIAASMVNLQRQYFEDTNADTLLAACIEATDLRLDQTAETVAEASKFQRQAVAHLEAGRKSSAVQALSSALTKLKTIGKGQSIPEVNSQSPNSEIQTSLDQVQTEVDNTPTPHLSAFGTFCKEKALDQFAMFMADRGKVQNTVIASSANVANLVLRQTQIDYCTRIITAYDGLAAGDKTDPKYAQLKAANDTCLKISGALIGPLQPS